MSSPVWNRDLIPFRGCYLPGLQVIPKTNTAVQEGCNNIQAPLDITLLTAVSAMSTCIQGGFNVLAPYGKELPTSLWILGVADPGERKDSVTHNFYAGYSRIREEQRHEYKKDHKIWKVKKISWNKRYQLLKKSIELKLINGESVESEEAALEKLIDEEPVEPFDALLILEDTTPAAIIDQVAKAGGYIAIVTAEGATFFQGKAAENLAFLNTAWTGTWTNIVRKNAKPIELSDPRVALLILVQPSVVIEYLKKKGAESRGNGWWSRVLLFKSQSTQGYRELSAGEISTVGREWFAERVHALANESIHISRDDTLNRHVVVLSRAAEVRWREVAREIERQIRPGGRFDCASDHASKLAENILRLAAVLHIFEGLEGEISAEVIEVAVGICFYCSDQFLQLFTGPSQEEVEMQLLFQWVQFELARGRRYILRNNVMNHGPSAVRKTKGMARAIDRLIFDGVIAEFEVQRGRVTKALDLNPRQYFDKSIAIQALNLPEIYRM
ncbi:DUF3987 domain-containing protein [Pseudomonas sp. CrR25]|nr:DUF3987 domain-containing protein [Pseudomonas sp. CrR25]